MKGLHSLTVALFSMAAIPEGCTLGNVFFVSHVVSFPEWKEKNKHIPGWFKAVKRCDHLHTVHRKKMQSKVADPSWNARTSQDTDLVAVRVSLLVTGLHLSGVRRNIFFSVLALKGEREKKAWPGNCPFTPSSALKSFRFQSEVEKNNLSLTMSSMGQMFSGCEWI